MREVGVLEAKTQLSSLLDEVERGGDIVITRHGRPVARLTGAASDRSRPRKSGTEIAETFRELRERVRLDWPGEPEFDWRAAIEEGRE